MCSSAKGAAFIAAWGSAPGRRKCKTASAESAIHSEGLQTQEEHHRTCTFQEEYREHGIELRRAICVGLMVGGYLETRFQRLVMDPESWGDAPGWRETSAFALNRYEAYALLLCLANSSGATYLVSPKKIICPRRLKKKAAMTRWLPPGIKISILPFNKSRRITARVRSCAWVRKKLSILTLSQPVTF